MVIIPRDIYLRKMIRSRNNGLIKTITGIRRCGKSVLLSSIFHQWLSRHGIPEDHIIDIAMDDKRYQSLRTPDAFINHIDQIINDKGEYVLLVDEVQLIDDFVGVLISLLHIDNCDIYVTGSNSKFLSSDIATEFRGRSEEIYVQPLCFSEFSGAYGGEKEDAWREYYLYGGLPQLLSLRDDEQKADYLSGLYKTVYIADMVERNHIKNDDGLESLIRILASSIGSSTNPSRISNTFKSAEHETVSTNTLKKFIQYARESFIVSEALRYDVKGRKYIGTENKYYFSDIGLRNGIIGFRQIEENHIMENVIYNELLLRGFKVDVGRVSTSEKTAQGKEQRSNLEVDFVANQGSRRYYVQAAYRMDDELKVAQEKRSLQLIDDSFKKFIIVKDNIVPYHDFSGFVIMGLFDFLLNPNSLDY